MVLLNAPTFPVLFSLCSELLDLLPLSALLASGSFSFFAPEPCCSVCLLLLESFLFLSLPEPDSLSGSSHDSITFESVIVPPVKNDKVTALYLTLYYARRLGRGGLEKNWWSQRGWRVLKKFQRKSLSQCALRKRGSFIVVFMQLGRRLFEEGKHSKQ